MNRAISIAWFIFLRLQKNCMKKLFWLGLVALVLFEIANVYFIMPMPGSQQMNSLDVAYFLYRWRWWFRTILVLLMLVGLIKTTWKRKWMPALGFAVAGAVVYILNFQMAADKMFQQVQQLSMLPTSQNKVDTNRLVIGINIGNEAKAYPIRFLGYHHFVADSIDGKAIFVTYCTVCRTGRVFEPMVDGVKQNFRVVGMDHFNAMIEDATTKSWWRQATGEAVAGSLKGSKLKEINSRQTTLAQWLTLYPHSLVMQADPAFADKYDTTLKYEEGSSRKQLTGTDSLSWKNKSWVVGITINQASKAFDWNALKQEKIIHSEVGNQPIVIVLAEDKKSFFAFERTNAAQRFSLHGDTLTDGQLQYSLKGLSYNGSTPLQVIPAYQEFWHSWQTFHPQTGRYPLR
jgi:hypothetical protein